MYVSNAYLTIINTFFHKIIFPEKNSGKFRPESGKIEFPVPVKPEPEQGFEIPVPDLLEPECQKIYSGSVKKNRNYVFTNPVSGSGS